MVATGVQGLFADMDGTLADSMGLMREVYGEFLAERGAAPSDAEFSALAGQPLRQTVAQLSRRHGLTEPPEQLLDRYYRLVDARYLEYAKPMPGAAELLAAARERGLFVAMVTSARRTLGQGFLARHDLARHVDLVVGAEDVRRGKPDPEPFALALRKSGLSATQGLAVEDTALGARSAAGTGMPVWVLHPDGGRGFPLVNGVAGFIHDLRELIYLIN